MFEELKKRVLDENLRLVKLKLVIFTWGNVSEIDREHGIIAIKPSGVEYDKLSIDDIVLLNTDGKIIEGKLNPSSDTPTHIELYRQFSKIGGIVHTHSTYATAFAQSGYSIPCFGTTHADYFYGDIPCTRALTCEETETDYELNTGRVIAQTFEGRNYLEMPAVTVKSHGPFCWGETAAQAVCNAKVLEQVAKMAYLTKCINPDAKPAEKYLLDKHYLRKHGIKAYYGQSKQK